MNHEDRLCCALYGYIQSTYPHTLKSWAHIPNGGKRPQSAASLFQRMGVLAGFSDYICTRPSSHWHCLFLEIKTDTGSISKDQIEFLQEQTLNGHFAICTYGYSEAATIIDAWVCGTIHRHEHLVGSFKKSERNAAYKAAELAWPVHPTARKVRQA